MPREKRARLDTSLHPDNKKRLVKAAQGLGKPVSTVLDDLIALYLSSYMETHRP